MPTLSLVAKIDKLLLEVLLEYVSEEVLEMKAASRPATYYQCLWIYALLLLLQKPLLADICAILNQIYDLMISSKASYSKEYQDFAQYQRMTSIVICIIKSYFGQTYRF